jgi:glucose-6-phosphate 1-dehydrogenase
VSCLKNKTQRMHAGVLRDMFQNHLLQLLMVTAMEAPARFNASAVRNEKVKVLEAIGPVAPEEIGRVAVRGQYGAGTIDGQPVPGYREEPDVADDSVTDTFAALRLEVDNWRWAGVPFYIRTGKRLAGRIAYIEVNFRPAPHAIYKSPLGAGNRLVIHLQPKDGLELHLFAQGQQNRLTSQTADTPLSPVQLDLDFDKRFGSERVGAYERLLLDVIDGRLNLFVRSDEQEEAWRWVEPIMQSWEADAEGPRPYAAGTWGPSASSAMIARDGYCWTEEC